MVTANMANVQAISFLTSAAWAMRLSADADSTPSAVRRVSASCAQSLLPRLE